jgi:hypothetical protein
VQNPEYGFNRVRTSRSTTAVITKGTLNEVSYLRAGACEQTSAVLEDADKVGLLFEDCKTSRLVSDNKLAHVMRTLQQLS